MSYRVEITRNAEKLMRNLNGPMRKPIRTRINTLRDDPHHNASKLKSRPGFRQRVGDYITYKITYEINDIDRVVKVMGVFQRREAYR